MQVKLVNGRPELLNDDGEIVTVNGEEIADDHLNGEGSSSFVWRSFAKTEAGNDFYENYYDLPENQRNLLEVFDKLYPDGRATTARLVDAFNTALAAGEFVAKPKETVASRRDSTGRFADRHTLLRQEIRRSLADPTVPAASLRARASVDSAYRAAWEAELTPQPPSAPPPPDDLPELKSFVKRWRAAKDVRPIAGVVTLVDHEYTVAELDDLISRATAARLL